MEVLLVEYANDIFLHERRILACPPGRSVIAVTPHGDVYEEELASSARVFRPTAARNAVPPAYRNGSNSILFRRQLGEESGGYGY